MGASRTTGAVLRSSRTWSAAAAIALLFAWWAGGAGGWLPPSVIPSPQDVSRAFLTASTRGFADATLAQHLGASLGRLAAALAVAVAMGVPLGLWMGTSRTALGLIDPWIQLYKPVPSLAYLGLIVLWLGVGEVSRITLLALAGLPPVAIGTAEAVRAVRVERVQAARSLGVRGADLFRAVVLPSALPGVISSVRIAATGIFTTLVAAEMIGARRGLGAMLLAAGYTMQLGMVVVGLLAMGATGLLLDQTFRWAQAEFTPWWGRF